jgi:predicted alpha/beta superfamily hydrolase
MRGGKRIGSGRKKDYTKKAQITIYLEQSEKDKLIRYARGKGKSVAQFIKEFIASFSWE